jgi:hypothetical protein
MRVESNRSRRKGVCGGESSKERANKKSKKKFQNELNIIIHSVASLSHGHIVERTQIRDKRSE